MVLRKLKFNKSNIDRFLKNENIENEKDLNKILDCDKSKTDIYKDIIKYQSSIIETITSLGLLFHYTL